MPYKDKEKKQEHDRLYGREKYLKCKRLGICYECGKPADLGFVLCATCAYKGNLRDRMYYFNNREQLLSKSNERDKLRLLNHQCRRCSSPLIGDEVNYCFSCMTRGTRANKNLIEGVLTYETAD